MISFLFNALILIICLFVISLLLLLMFWVVMRVLRSLFPQKFSTGARRKRDEV